MKFALCLSALLISSNVWAAKPLGFGDLSRGKQIQAIKAYQDFARNSERAWYGKTGKGRKRAALGFFSEAFAQASDIACYYGGWKSILKMNSRNQLTCAHPLDVPAIRAAYVLASKDSGCNEEHDAIFCRPIPFNEAGCKEQRDGMTAAHHCAEASDLNKAVEYIRANMADWNTYRGEVQAYCKTPGKGWETIARPEIKEDQRVTCDVLNTRLAAIDPILATPVTPPPPAAPVAGQPPAAAPPAAGAAPGAATAAAPTSERTGTAAAPTAPETFCEYTQEGRENRWVIRKEGDRVKLYEKKPTGLVLVNNLQDVAYAKAAGIEGMRVESCIGPMTFERRGTTCLQPTFELTSVFDPAGVGKCTFTFKDSTPVRTFTVELTTPKYKYTGECIQKRDGKWKVLGETGDFDPVADKSAKLATCENENRKVPLASLFKIDRAQTDPTKACSLISPWVPASATSVAPPAAPPAAAPPPPAPPAAGQPGAAGSP
ncbi:MAG: hypothetical protein ABL958_07415 [Bdellovibrionia bacterium]